MLHLAFALVSPLLGQCAMDAEIAAMPAFDPNAPVSLDVLEGPAPTNLVVFRAADRAPARALLAHDESSTALDPSFTRGFLPRFEASPLVAERAYTFTVSDGLLEEGDTSGASRSVSFASGALTDVEPPRIEGEATFHVEHFRGGPSLDCGPQWVSDRHAYSVELPEATDDGGVAAFELRATFDGVESAIAGTVNTKDALLEAIVWGDEPERLRVVAIDHAGNESKPEVASDGAGGCAQSGVSTWVSLAFAFVVAWRRRAVRANVQELSSGPSHPAR